jgi:hypothetical protein
MGRMRREPRPEKDREQAIIYAIMRGVNRFKQMWTDLEIREFFGSENTLSADLDRLVRKGLLTRNRVSHKNVVYEMSPSQTSEWFLTTGTIEPAPVDMEIFEAILRRIGDKAKAVHIALNFLLKRFFPVGIDSDIVPVMLEIPEFRKAALDEAADRFVTRLAERDHSDRSDLMIGWQSRHYRLFLENLRTLLLKHPRETKKFLRKKPWFDSPPDNRSALGSLRGILAERYPNEKVELENEIRDEIVRLERQGAAETRAGFGASRQENRYSRF